MALHARNIDISAGAINAEVDTLVKGLVDSGKINFFNAKALLKKLRA
jgi:hydroxymethylglutaryl-CoA reductase